LVENQQPSADAARQQIVNSQFSSKQNMKQHNLVNINIQSGASLAMRGHVAHKHGGYILEGKFMDVGHQGATAGAELEAK